MNARFHDDPTCDGIVATITEYLEGVSSPDERARFDAHVASCRVCTHYLAQMRGVLRVSGKVGLASSLSPEVRQSLLRIFRGWSTRAATPPRRRPNRAD